MTKKKKKVYVTKNKRLLLEAIKKDEAVKKEDVKKDGNN